MGLRLLAEPGCAIFKVPFGWIAAAYGPVPGSGLANRNLAALFCPEAPVPTPNPGADCPEPPEPAPELELPLPELPDPELPLFELPDPEPDGPLPELGPVPFPLFDECELLVLAQFARNKVEVRISARANNCRTCDIRPPKDREPEFELLDECSAVQRLPVTLAGSGFQTPSLSIEKRKGLSVSWCQRGTFTRAVTRLAASNISAEKAGASRNVCDLFLYSFPCRTLSSVTSLISYARAIVPMASGPSPEPRTASVLP